MKFKILTKAVLEHVWYAFRCYIPELSTRSSGIKEAVSNRTSPPRTALPGRKNHYAVMRFKLQNYQYYVLTKLRIPKVKVASAFNVNTLYVKISWQKTRISKSNKWPPDLSINTCYFCTGFVILQFGTTLLVFENWIIIFGIFSFQILCKVWRLGHVHNFLFMYF